MIKKEFQKLHSALMRKYHKAIDKNYIRKKLKKRTGKCNKCGKCCEGCIYLDKNTKLCKTYKKRPWFCYREFPLDKNDQKVWAVEKVCGYKFRSKS